MKKLLICIAVVLALIIVGGSVMVANDLMKHRSGLEPFWSGRDDDGL
jgi:hypothetical protein